MHDTVWFESQGTPAVFLLSSEFVGAAAAQASALGLAGVRYIAVPHPIQDASDDEMVAKADQALDEVLDALAPRAT